MISFLTTLIVLLLLPLTGQATDFYVNGATGDNGNSCNHADQACKTIKAALDKTPVGHHTIRVTKGLYAEEPMTVPGHKFITIKGGYDENFTPVYCSGNPETIIQTGAAPDNATLLALHISGDGNEASLALECLGLEYKRSSGNGFFHGISIESQENAHVRFSMDQVQISGFIFTPLEMLALINATLSIDINHSVFMENSTYLPGPLILTSCDASDVDISVKNTLIENNLSFQEIMLVNNFKGGHVHLAMENSILANPGLSASTVGFAVHALPTNNTSDTQLEMKNTTIFNLFWPIEILAGDQAAISFHGINNLLMRNNDPVEHAIFLSAKDSASIDFTSSYSIMGQYPSSNSHITVNVTNAVSGDPLLDSRYHLKEGSPAINTGICGEYVPTPTFHYERIAPYDDIDGDKRPGFGAYLGCDIGADEYKAFPWPMFLPAIIHPRHNPYTIPTTPHF